MGNGFVGGGKQNRRVPSGVTLVLTFGPPPTRV